MPSSIRFVVLSFAAGALVAFASSPANAGLYLGAEELIQADAVDIDVDGYSVPSYTDWDNDGLSDLIVGEGNGTYPDAKVRVYLNIGTTNSPQFSSFFYAQSEGADLTTLGVGCQGLFPRVVYWNDDGKKDLLIGLANGTVMLFLNTATDSAPAFDAGTFLQFGESGAEVDIAVGGRATPIEVDWNNDGMKDLMVGGIDGRFRLYLNTGTDPEPVFRTEQLLQESGTDLWVPTGRSSPHVGDFTDDGMKDILTGNTYGELILYTNVGTDEAPVFSGYDMVEADGVPIDLSGYARSRPFVCDWTGDGYLDVLIGAGDGNVHLCPGAAEPTSVPLPGEKPFAFLRYAYPNPFTRSSTISFRLAESEWVRLSVYDAAGREVAVLADSFYGEGPHGLIWDGRDGSGNPVASGIYYYHLKVRNRIESKTVVRLK